MEKSNSGMHHQRQALTKGKSNTLGGHISSSAQERVIKPPALAVHGKSLTSNSKPSPRTSGNPSTSRLCRPAPRDSDSDDDAPLVFRANPIKQATSLSVQIKDQMIKNGMTSSRVNVDDVRKGSGNGCQQSTEQSLPSDDSDEDNRPLASRVPAKRPPELLLVRPDADDDSDEDDDKPLVLKRATNGSSKSDNSLQKLLQKDYISNKKRPPDEILKCDSAGKKLKLLPKPLTTISSSPKPFSSTPKVLFNTPKLLSCIPKPRSSSPKPPSNLVSKPLPSSIPKLSSNFVSKPPPSSASKPSSNCVSPTTSLKPSSASPIPPKPSIVSSKLSDITTNAAVKMEIDDDEDDVPLAQRISVTEVAKKATVVKKTASSSTSESTKKLVVLKNTGNSLTSSVAAKKLVEAKKAKLKQQQKLKRKRVKDEKNAPGAGGGQKWTTLEHNGVIFPPPYTPHGIKMLYENKPVNLTPAQEEVATMFAVMRDTDYATKPKFLSNFWNDWKKILGPNHVIQSLEGCDFTPIYQWHLAEKEKKKQMSAEEKKKMREEKQKQEEKYMWALLDGVKEKVGNFRVEPPGLFRGRGEHPKMGKLKRRIFPEDIVINIGKDAQIPECPMAGHSWKEIRHDDTVTWLAYWNDPINTREFKYVFLGASSTLKGQSDKEKYEKSRTLKDYIEDIRRTYTRNFTSLDVTKRQIAVATYLIDQLALRAGNEKDDDEADTVGCCSLKVEHVTLVPPSSLQFDFLGKDSIRYFNTVEVVEPVYKAIGDFKKSKKNGHDLFDQLDTSKLNAHLKNIMPHLTAKVFRTYNASITLDRLLVNTDGHTVQEKIASYQKANKEVAILCNHQRSVSKSHGAQMERLEAKMAELKELLKELHIDLDRAKRGKPPLKDADGKPKRNQNPEALEKKIQQTKMKVEKMELEMRIKDDLKTVALGTSKINYMDPRITVAWCKRHEVPIEKIFNKSLLAKFSWAMDVDMEYHF